MKANKDSARRRASRLGLAVMAAGALSTLGCYKATFVEDPTALERKPTHEEWTDHFVFGLVGNEKYDTSDWCPSGTGAVRTGGNVGTTVVTIVTIGIYAPRKVYVTCEGTRVASVTEVSR